MIGQCEKVSFYIGVLLSVTGFFKDCFKSHFYVYVWLHECMGADKVHKRVNFPGTGVIEGCESLNLVLGRTLRTVVVLYS